MGRNVCFRYGPNLLFRDEVRFNLPSPSTATAGMIAEFLHQHPPDTPMLKNTSIRQNVGGSILDADYPVKGSIFHAGSHSNDLETQFNPVIPTCID